jgi:hypothetical protein
MPGPEPAEEERELLAGNFVDDNSLWVLDAPILCSSMRGPDSDQRHSDCQETLDIDERVDRKRNMEIDIAPCPGAKDRNPPRERRQYDTPK